MPLIQLALLGALIGVPLGYAMQRTRLCFKSAYREFRWQVPDWPSTLRMGTAGLIMGLSATIAGGCNIGHGFSGVPTLALSSLTATLFTFLGAALGNYLRFVRPQRIEFHAPPP